MVRSEPAPPHFNLPFKAAKDRAGVRPNAGSGPGALTYPGERFSNDPGARSAQLLEQQAGTVSEIAYQVGFKSPAHFSRLFHQVFGVSPSQYSAQRCSAKTTGP